MDTEDVLPPLPPLPQTIWDTIVQLIFKPTRALDVALEEIRDLSLVCQSLRRACKNAVLRLDASRSLDAHVAALAKLPIAVEYLELDGFYNREFVLRSDKFIKHSALTLKHISAAVRCTDTLANFPLLHTLKLHGQESFPKLYPAVLANVTNLKHLELVNYEHEVVFNDVPLDVLSRLETLTVRPRPDGRQYYMHGQVSVPLKLKRLELSCSIESLQAENFAPCPCLQLSAILAAAEEIYIEAGMVTLISCQEGQCVSFYETFELGSKWVARELLNAPKTLKRIEFRLLNDTVAIRDSNEAFPETRNHVLGLRGALEERAPRDRYSFDGLLGSGVLGDIQWSFNIEMQSIFSVRCLRVWRTSSFDSW